MNAAFKLSRYFYVVFNFRVEFNFLSFGEII